MGAEDRQDRGRSEAEVRQKGGRREAEVGASMNLIRVGNFLFRFHFFFGNE